ncbi:hypothetical protein KM043_005220 [Ampulex compressa]|nr:hypothetical protein KM043_005220 [Ampulex compressa]
MPGHHRCEPKSSTFSQRASEKLLKSSSPTTCDVIRILFPASVNTSMALHEVPKGGVGTPPSTRQEDRRKFSRFLLEALTFRAEGQASFCPWHVKGVPVRAV